MGEWQHPQHYTEQAKEYAKATRKAEIGIFIDRALPELRAAARVHGYTIAIHGSLIRDLDLVAIPWTDDASDAETLLTAICEAVSRMTGWGQNAKRASRTQKPHGRIAVTIVASAEINLDLSIMPLLKKE